jgi:hypothetical protein
MDLKILNPKVEDDEFQDRKRFLQLRDKPELKLLSIYHSFYYFPFTLNIQNIEYHKDDN